MLLRDVVAFLYNRKVQLRWLPGRRNEAIVLGMASFLNSPKCGNELDLE